MLEIDLRGDVRRDLVDAAARTFGLVARHQTEVAFHDGHALVVLHGDVAGALDRGDELAVVDELLHAAMVAQRAVVVSGR